MENRYIAKITSYQVQDSDKVTYSIIVNDTAKQSIFTSKFRYSELKNIHEKLKKYITKYKIGGGAIQLPHYPGSKLFGSTNKNEEAIIERKNDIELYLNELLQVKKLWALKIMEQLIGPPNCQDDRFLDEYFKEEEKEIQQINPILENNSQMQGGYYKVNIESFCREEDTIKYFFKFYDLDNKITWECKYRYSELKGIHERLQKEAKNTKIIPKFPGKQLFSITNEDKQEIYNRRDNLQNYVNQLLADPQLLELPIIQYLLRDSKINSEGNEMELRELQFKFIMKKLKMKREQAKQFIIQSDLKGFQNIKEYTNEYVQKNQISSFIDNRNSSIKSSITTLKPITEENERLDNNKNNYNFYKNQNIQENQNNSPTLVNKPIRRNTFQLKNKLQQQLQTTDTETQQIQQNIIYEENMSNEQQQNIQNNNLQNE
ncbi:Phox homologous domain [Pseudocohnilembus persalinus]|uniref:Phox homologous domain n=1 Tax=Pseudocohnilembus persalinus TaxID=266149 RepID=A0A0V0QFN2_PSEPJ|nr:Phox homologous domain [Pseudocohnilembus persalinus]|eukprot:KRX00972.1 Phox homologous domain [Pseudocohnilembus persalinus]